MYSKYIKIILRFGDYLILNLAFWLGFQLRVGNWDLYFPGHYFEYELYINLAWALSAYLLNVYKIHRSFGYIHILRILSGQFLLHALAVAAFIGLAKSDYSRLVFAYSTLSTTLLISLWRLSVAYYLRSYRKRGNNFRNVALVGADENASEFQQLIRNHPEYGYRLVAIFNEKALDHPLWKGNIDQLQRWCLNEKIDELFCSLGSLTKEQVSGIIAFAENNLLRIKLLPESKGFHYGKMKIELYDDLPILTIRPLPLDDPFNRTIKRSFDVVFSVVVIVLLLWWLIPLLAIWIKIDSKGPVFFKQQRNGLNSKLFWCYKLRTMTASAVADSKQATRDDQRITKAGSFLRKTSLDELPQFLNVLWGDMSVVGPRPHMVSHTETYSNIINKYMIRHLVKPGVTGLSQVKGFRGETKDAIQMQHRIRIDIFYIENWSFFLDLNVILKTVILGIKGDSTAF